MERYLFYMYLEYLKENKLTFWPKLWKQPKIAIILMLVVVLSWLASFVISFFKTTQYWSIVTLAMEIISCVILYFYTEHYMIACSKKRTNEYCDYCKKIKNWLNSCNVNDEEKIKVLLGRVNESMKEIEIIEQKSQDRIEKWLQALVIPIVLAIITTILGSNSDMNGMITGISTVIILFISVYMIYIAVSKIVSFPNKRMHEQLKCFSSDLQGVLDTQFPDSIFKQPETNSNTSPKRKNG